MVVAISPYVKLYERFKFVNMYKTFLVKNVVHKLHAEMTEMLQTKVTHAHTYILLVT